MLHSKGITRIKSYLIPINYPLQLATQCTYIHVHMSSLLLKMCMSQIFYSAISQAYIHSDWANA